MFVSNIPLQISEDFGYFLILPAITVFFPPSNKFGQSTATAGKLGTPRFQNAYWREIVFKLLLRPLIAFEIGHCIFA